MKLDDYVSETLLAIIRGVVTAQGDVALGANVARAGGTMPIDRQGNSITMVSFDLATTNEDKGSAGAGISVVPFASAKGQIASAISSANRLQFAIPISIPKPTEQREADAARRRSDSGAIENRSDATWQGR